MGFSVGSDGKESACNVGDPGSFYIYIYIYIYSILGCANTFLISYPFKALPVTISDRSLVAKTETWSES